MAEFEAIQLLRANALRDLGLPDLAATAFVALRDELARRKDPAVGEAMSRAEFLAIDERLAAHQYDEAGKLFDWFSKDIDAPTWFPFNLYGGVVRQARGDATGAVPLLENAARLLLQSSDHAAWAFHDEAERRRQVTWLAESLLRTGRTDLALDVAGFMLAEAPDLAELRAIRAAALRTTRGREWDTCVEDLALLRMGRDGGRRFAQWEADWNRMRGGPKQYARAVADQGARLLRVFSNDLTVDKALADLVKSAKTAHGDGKSGGARDLSFQTAGSVLLRELDGDPGMVLRVYRWLVAKGHRDEAFLLLHGLVESEPAIADFRLLLARHDLADGRLRDALAILESLLERRPDDVEVAALASDVARRTFEVERARKIEDAAIGDAPHGAALLLAARAALADGYPDLVLEMARAASAADADGRALLGLAARAEVGAGELEAADALARPVLAQDPLQRDALAAFLAVLGSRAFPDGTTECDAWLAEHPAALAGLDVDDLADLGRMLLGAGDAGAAGKVLETALAREPEHALARLTLADVLLTERRDDELEKLLDPAHLRNDDLEGIRRLAMLRLLRDGPIPAHNFLRGHIAAGASEDDLARITTLTGAAAGRISASFGLAARRGLALDRDEKRLLALAVLAWNAPKADAAALPEVAAMTLLPADDSLRDRELERWISLDLASPDHRFLGSLVALALLDRLPELAALRDSVRTRLFATTPSLGEIARREARRLDERGDRAAAAALRALVLVSDALTGEQLDRLCEALRDPAAPAGLATAMNALRERMRGDPAHAAALLEEAAQDPACRPVARLVQAQLAGRHDVLAATFPVELAPWCDVGRKAHATTGDAAVDRLLGDALEAAPADRLVLAALRLRLAKAGDRIDPPQRKRYVYALVKQPGPWFEAFEAALATAAHAAPDAARTDALARALGAAIEIYSGPVLPTAALRALARLADLQVAAGQPEMAALTIARAEQACPSHPDLLAAKGRLALSEGDERRTRSCFGRAHAFGSRAPDVLHWLGRDALAFGRPREAAEVEELALASGPVDAAQRAEMHEVLARARFMLGATAEARAAWTAAALARGGDPGRSLPIALETFAREGPEVAKPLLESLAASPGPAQELARALLGIAVRPSAEEPVIPAKDDEPER
jgi:tetratricopeptide (TPR) repeat protein